MAKDTKEIASFQEIMHLAVTAAAVLLSIASLVSLIAAGCREKAARGTGIRAAAALVLMMAGSVGTGIVPAQYSGIADIWRDWRTVMEKQAVLLNGPSSSGKSTLTAEEYIDSPKHNDLGSRY